MRALMFCTHASSGQGGQITIMRLALPRLLTGILWLTFPLMASAATYHVRVGGSGTCASATAESGAVGDLQDGVNCVTGAGDTVVVHAGTYGHGGGGSLTLPSPDGDASQPITVRAASGDTVWFMGGLDMWAHDARYWVIDGINIDRGYWPNNCAGNPDDIACRAIAAAVSSFGTLQNLEVKNASYYGIAASADSTFRCVKSHGHGQSPQSLCGGNPGQAGGQCHGFYTHDERVLFDGVEASGNDGQGIALTHGAASVTVHNSTLRDNVFGIQFAYGGSGNLIINNVVEQNRIGFYVFGTSGNQFSHNTVSRNGSGIELVSGSHNNTLTDNLVSNNGQNIVDEGSNTITGQGPGANIGSLDGSCGAGPKPPGVAGKLPPPTNFRRASK